MKEFQFPYELKTTYEKIGDQTLAVQSLKDLNQTIDRLFEQLEKDGNPALLEELCPYFGCIWPSARVLTQMMLKLGPSRLQGKQILEVGCGLALPSLLVAKLGLPITAADFHPEVPRFLERNLKLNGLTQDLLNYVHLDWKTPDAFQRKFDWVIGSDILYERQHSSQVAQTINRLVSSQGRALITDPGRPYLQGFADEMITLGFICETQVERIEIPGETNPKEAVKDIFILLFSRHQSGGASL